MEKQSKIKHDEFIEKLRNQDEALLRLIKQGHRELILRVIKDYLQQNEL